jgi:hypothetical protein
MILIITEGKELIDDSDNSISYRILEAIQRKLGRFSSIQGPNPNIQYNQTAFQAL